MLVYALDANYGDFLVSSQQDPRLLDEPRFSGQGGVGLFASMAPDSVVYQVVSADQAFGVTPMYGQNSSPFSTFTSWVVY